MASTGDALDVDGEAVLAYRIYAGPPPVAEDVVALADLDVVVPAILDRLAGWWLASEDDRLTDLLLEAGATLVRHGHLYRRSIVRRDADLALTVPEGFVLEPLSAPARELAVVAEAAYDHDHPDFDLAHDTEGDLAGLLSGTIVGQFIAYASWQVTHDGVVVAACVINLSEGEPPFGGPWVSELFRLPGAAYRGLGAVLLQKAITSFALWGEPSLSLVVTDGNPAAQLYERLGFVHHSGRRKIAIPGEPQSRAGE